MTDTELTMVRDLADALLDARCDLGKAHENYNSLEESYKLERGAHGITRTQLDEANRRVESKEKECEEITMERDCERQKFAGLIARFEKGLADIDKMKNKNAKSAMIRAVRIDIKTYCEDNGIAWNGNGGAK